MSAREELATIIASPESFDGGPASSGPNPVYAARTADAILAKGYRKPEVVSYVVITRDGRFVKDFGDNKQAAADFAAESTADCTDAGIDYDYRVAEIVEAQA